MPKKIEITDQQNKVITDMVKDNHTLEEIAESLLKDGFKISLPTLSNYIKKLGLDKVDCRKWSGNHSKGYATKEVIKSKEKIPSKYKMNKYSDEEISIEDVKRIGIDNDGKPIFFKVDIGRTGKVEGVECLVTEEMIKKSDCILESKKWWILERMRFDFGQRYRSLIPGQKKGDWRGVVKRFELGEDGCFRYDDVDIIKEQQDAWKRYVDARFNYKKQHTYHTQEEVDSNNIFILNQLDASQLNEVIELSPVFVFKYIPSYLYGAVVDWCLTKMEDDMRIENMTSKQINALRQTIKNTKVESDGYFATKITLDIIKRYLLNHPNEYGTVIQQCAINAISKGLIDKRYVSMLVSIVSNIRFKWIDETMDSDGDDSVDWFAADGILNRVVSNEEKMKERYGFI